MSLFQPKATVTGNSLLLVSDFPDNYSLDMWQPYHEYGAAYRYLDMCGLDWAGVRNAFYVFEDAPVNIHDVDNSFSLSKKATEDQSPQYEMVKSRIKRYIKPKFRSMIDNIREAVVAAQPRVVFAMGEFSLWALTGHTSISKWRGSAIKRDDGIIVIPTYLPQTLDAQYSMRYYFHKDLQKALWYLANPGYEPKNRKIYTRPSLGTLNLFDMKYLQPSNVLVHDIETKPDAGIITCIGLSGCGDASLVIPFYDENSPDGNYWSEDDALKVLKFLRKVFARPTTKVAHNALYDVMWERLYGIPYDPNHEDTMLMYHSMQPELQKGLGILVSLYLKEYSWKNMVDFSSSNKTKDD